MEQLIRTIEVIHEPKKKLFMKIKSPGLMRPDYIFFVEGPGLVSIYTSATIY